MCSTSTREVTTTTAATTDATLTSRSQPEGACHVRHARCRPPAKERGFALLETLVAFVIAALALAVLYQAGLSGLRATQVASHYEQAVARARSHLTLAEHASPLVAGDWRGDDGGGFVWHLRVTPLASTMVQPKVALTALGSRGFPLTLYSITVSITWHDSDTARQVRLDWQQIGQGVR